MCKTGAQDGCWTRGTGLGKDHGKRPKAAAAGPFLWSCPLRDAPPSPCRNLCRLEARICAGCGRTTAEIARWPAAGAREKREILGLSAARLAARAAERDIALDSI